MQTARKRPEYAAMMQAAWQRRRRASRNILEIVTVESLPSSHNIAGRTLSRTPKAVTYHCLDRSHRVWNPLEVNPYHETDSDYDEDRWHRTRKRVARSDPTPEGFVREGTFRFMDLPLE
jgi:hypothetical protein